MMNKKIARLATAMALCLPLLAAAQVDPADPGAAAAPLRYVSAFGDYQPWQDLPAGDWKAVNAALLDAAGPAAAAPSTRSRAAPPPDAAVGSPQKPSAATAGTPGASPVPAMPGHSMHGGSVPGHPMPGSESMHGGRP